MKNLFHRLLLASIVLQACKLPITQTNGASPQTVPTAESAPATDSLPPTDIPAAQPSNLICIDAECLAQNISINYLIVTRPMFLDALQPFVTWKTTNGFRVGLVTVEWLDVTYSGRHLAEKMKTGMHDLRKKTGLVYVLLVGDTAISHFNFQVASVLKSYHLGTEYNVPTGFYRRLESDPVNEVLPSDAYFVEDRDWDPLNTGVNPRPEDMVNGEGTIVADFYLGRLPVQTIEDLNIVLKKTYQLNPSNNILFTADASLSDGVNTSCSGLPPSQFEDFYCYLDALVIGRNTYFESNAPWLTTDSMFVDLNNQEQSGRFLNKFISYEGVIFASYHGAYDCWQLSASECYTPERMKFDNIFPLLEAEACNLSAFYSDQGRSASEGIFISNTGPIIFTQAPNPLLFALGLRDGLPAGEAFWKGTSEYVYFPNPIAFFGDPSVIVLQTQ